MFTVADCSLVIGQLMPEPQSGLLSGILYGTKATLSRDFLTDLTTTGTIHMVALSGTNITIVMTIVGKLLAGLVPRRILSILIIVFIGLFVLWVGPTPSVVRAAIMGSIGCLAVIFGRRNIGALTWLLACSIMVLFRPLTITDLSFQLSALSSLGLVLCDTGPAATKDRDVEPDEPHSRETVSVTSEPITQAEDVPVFSVFVRNCYKPFISGLVTAGKAELRTTLAAQVFTLPLLLFVFGRVSVVAPLTNLAIGWTIPIVTSLGFAMVAIGCLFPLFALPLAWVNTVLLTYLMYVVRFSAGLPFASIGV